ncbi:hypothetical protein STEG23_011903 [Scotinomys teguina]
MDYGHGLGKTAWEMGRLFTSEGKSACLWSSTLKSSEQDLVCSMAWFNVSVGMASGPVDEREELLITGDIVHNCLSETKSECSSDRIHGCGNTSKLWLSVGEYYFKHSAYI